MKSCLSLSAIVLTVLHLVPAAAQETAAIPVPVRPIFPGQSLNSAEITTKLFYMPDASRSSYVTNKDQLIGKEALQTLSAGKPIALRLIRLTEDVKKGQPTKAIYSSGTIEIQGKLVPLINGTVGQVVQARNTSSGSVVNAMVMEDGTLLVVEK